MGECFQALLPCSALAESAVLPTLLSLLIWFFPVLSPLSAGGDRTCLEGVGEERYVKALGKGLLGTS